MKKEELQGQEPLTSSSAEKGKLVAEKKGNFFALLPILVFLVLFIGMGVWSGACTPCP